MLAMGIEHYMGIGQVKNDMDCARTICRGDERNVQPHGITEHWILHFQKIGEITPENMGKLLISQWPETKDFRSMF